MSLDCAKVVDAIARGVGLDAAFVQDHKAACVECASRVALARQIGPGPAIDNPAADGHEREDFRLLEEFKAGVRQQIGILGRWRGLGFPARLAVLAVLATLLVSSQYFNPRADLSAYPLGRMGLALGAFVLPMIWAWALALRSLHLRPLPSWWAWSLGVLVLTAHSILAAMPEVHTGHPASSGGLGQELVPRALACFLYGGLLSLPVLMAGIASVRTGARLPVLLLVAAVAAASVGNSVLQLHCPLTHPVHLLLGHASIGVFFAAAVWGWIALRG